MDTLPIDFQSLRLARWPRRSKETLRAWDAADEYLLQYLRDNGLPASDVARDTGCRVLVVNDAFGALSCALHAYSPVNWSDSSISHIALSHNLAANGLVADVTCVKSTQELTGIFDLVLIKIPKANALLEDQLYRLRPHLNESSTVIGAGMLKHLPRSAFQCFEKLVGPMTTSLARKKARLLFAQFNDSIVTGTSLYPTSYTDPVLGITLSNEANLFSRDHLDSGTRFLLSQYSAIPSASRVLDLACGNGVLGIMYRLQHPLALVRFVDESYMAIASTQHNFQSVFSQDELTDRFETSENMESVDDGSTDLVLCNPPFHQQYVIGKQLALQMFRDSKRCLQSHGELWVVANRHLDYEIELKRMFGNCRKMGSNKKFDVLRSIKR